MKRIILYTLLSLAALLPAEARKLSSQEALTLALHDRSLKSLSNDCRSYELVSTIGNRDIYIFNKNRGGYLILAGDTDFPALTIGYSNSGKIDSQNIPDAMKELLDLFASGAWRASDIDSEPRESIPPIVSTKWNQNSPYNDACPVSSSGAPTMTGCMATAASQVLKHWNYPTHGKGVATVTFENKDYTFDYESRPFDWENMLNEYESYNDEQAAAVAELMYGVGVACGMDYGTSQSGALTQTSAAALVEYLDYDKSLVPLWRNCYPMKEWIDIIYNELKQGRPMVYTGVSKAGGHAFVCDGYDGSNGDYFHINWGWGGLSDGYFLLANLDPGMQGIGGGLGAFSQQMTAFVNMKPAESDSKYIPNFCLVDGMFTTGKSEYNRGEEIRLDFMGNGALPNGGAYNFGITSMTVCWGLKLTDVNTQEVQYVLRPEELTYDIYSGVTYFDIDSSRFPLTGTYTVEPALQYEGEWYDVHQEIYHRLKITLECGEKLIFTTADTSEGIKISDLEITPRDIIANEKVNLKFSVTSNIDDFEGSLLPAIVSGSKRMATLTEKSLFIAAGETVELEWDEAFNKTLLEGIYKFYILTPNAVGDYDVVSGPYELLFLNNAVVPVMNLTEFTINDHPVSADKTLFLDLEEEIKASAQIKCVKGHLIADIVLGLASQEGNLLQVIGEGCKIDLLQNRSTDINISGKISSVAVEDLFNLALFDVEGDSATLLSSLVPVQFNESGIAEIFSPADESAEYFSLQGIKVGNPQSGVFLRVTHGKTKKVIIR